MYQIKAITSVSVTYTARFRFYSTNATMGDHTGLEAPVGCSESPKTVHNVGINCGVVEMVPVTAVCTKNEFCTALCDSAVC